jgi:glycosyltransferase involved in cell wall biosynthesis
VFWRETFYQQKQSSKLPYSDMKVLFVFSGIPLYMDALLRKLMGKGVEVITVIPTGNSSSLGKGVQVIGGQQTRYKIIESGEKKTAIGKNSIPALPQIIDVEKPDIFVAGWPYFIQFFLQPSLRKSLRKNKTRFVIREIPFQVPPYGKAISYFKEKPMYNEDMTLLSKGFLFQIKQWGIMQIRRYCYKRADGALAYSSLGKNLIPTYGIREENVFVTYNTGDSETLLCEKERVRQEPSILPVNSRRIIHVGRLVKWKRVDLLIDAFSNVIKEFPDAELVIIGEGPERENLVKLVGDLNIDQKVHFTGSVYDPKTIGAYMNASSIYVLAGMGGLSINDAMTYSLPIICSVCDGTERDLVTHNVNGLYFKENNAIDLSDKIKLLLRDSQLREKMGKASLSVIEEKINLESVSDRYMDAFIKIMR